MPNPHNKPPTEWPVSPAVCAHPLDPFLLNCWQGSEGVLYDVKALNPMPVPSVDLRHMGPMRLSRFWSAVHDTLLYADPRAASGGRVRVLDPALIVVLLLLTDFVSVFLLLCQWFAITFREPGCSVASAQPTCTHGSMPCQGLT